MLRFEGVQETDCLVSRSAAENPKVPSYNGGKFPLSTYLAERVRKMVHEPESWTALPDQVRDWLEMQKRKSRLPAPNRLLVETFPRGGKHYLVCYPFEGRLAHQTLGMLLTRRLERARLRPIIAVFYAARLPYNPSTIKARPHAGRPSPEEPDAQENA